MNKVQKLSNSERYASSEPFRIHSELKYSCAGILSNLCGTSSGEVRNFRQKAGNTAVEIRQANHVAPSMRKSWH
jgi:hypothetical protein